MISWQEDISNPARTAITKLLYYPLERTIKWVYAIYIMVRCTFWSDACKPSIINSPRSVLAEQNFGTVRIYKCILECAWSFVSQLPLTFVIMYIVGGHKIRFAGLYEDSTRELSVFFGFWDCGGNALWDSLASYNCLASWEHK